MLVEQALQDFLVALDLNEIVIDDRYITALSDVMSYLDYYDTFLPVYSALKCTCFIFSFALACGIIKVVLNK